MACRRSACGIPQNNKGEEAMSDVPCERVQQETAAYIRDLALELAAMARAARCYTLCSVLEMAEMEAGSLVDGNSPNPAQPPRSPALSGDTA